MARTDPMRGARDLPESESPTTEADDDAVRILTIHQAKGLEFPIVILPKLQDQPFFGSDFIIDRPNNRVEFKLGDDRSAFRTPGYLVAQRRDRVYADAEARRMLYVAVTRARDWLILPSFAADTMSKRDSFYTYLDEAAPHWLNRGADPDTLVISPRAFDAVPRPQRVLHLPPHEELRQQWSEHRDAAIDGGHRNVTTLTPSRLSQHDHQGTQDALHETADIGVDAVEPDDATLNPLDFGTAVHEALESANFGDLAVTRMRTTRICRKHHLPPEPVCAQVERALQSELIQRAARADVIHRELPLTTIKQTGGQTIITEGVADLLFSDHGRWVLVDYKSDETIPPERLNTYHRQLQTYASMLNDAGTPVQEAYILLTATGESIAVPLSDEHAS